MQCLILILTIVYCVSVTNCREFRDYDSDPYDDDLLVGDKPHYELKDAPQLFEKFIKDYSKTYSSERLKAKHYETFKKNLEEINRLNAGKEGETATFDINLFSDMEGTLADDDDDTEEDKEQSEYYSRTRRAHAVERVDMGSWSGLVIKKNDSN